jgi:DNA-binding CsgD family transcriptional regulator
VYRGQKRIPPDVAAQLAEHAADDPLTSRELEVLQLIGAGKANNLIASDLAITEETVKGHVKNILSKLGASDRTHAVTIAERKNCRIRPPLCQRPITGSLTLTNRDDPLSSLLFLQARDAICEPYRF